MHRSFGISVFVSLETCPEVELLGFPGDSMVKNLPAHVSCINPGLIPGLEDPLEKGMATQSSILAWEIPWTEESGGYSPWGHKRVRHDLATK